MYHERTKDAYGYVWKISGKKPRHTWEKDIKMGLR
jgi:hypothetical protein